jgi:hypothetical protein
VQALHRLADPRAGLPQRAHQHQRGEAAEVSASAGHGLVEPGVRVALPRIVAGMGQRHGAAGDLPSVDALGQGRTYRVLDRFEEGQREGTGLDFQLEVNTG